MPSAVAPNPRAAPHDHDNHEYDDAIEELFRDLPIERSGANNTTSAPAEPTRDIDQEVKVKKQRKPNPKLDEERLLSHNGLPRLRRITKSRLRFKGKGHEFSDISKLLSTYQLWLDDLYPRAKFRDALVMVEKVGHSKRMKVMRKAWLDDTKPFRKDPEEKEVDIVTMSGALPLDANGEQTNEQQIGNHDNIAADANHPRLDHEPDEDELDALLAEHDSVKSNIQAQTTRTARGPFEEDSDEDGVDALPAAEPLRLAHAAVLRDPTAKLNAGEPDFADEEEIMAGMDMW